MIHTRFSEPEFVIEDPVVEIHESQLKRLRARANLAIPSAILALVALALIGAGVVRVERTLRSIVAEAQGRSVALAAQVNDLGRQIEERTSSDALARAAREAGAAPIEHASATARQALSVAQQAAASVVPVTAHLAVVDSGLAGVRSDLAGLSKSGTAQGEQLAQVSRDLGALRASDQSRLTALDGQVKTHDALLRLQDQDVKSAKNWTRVVGAGTAAALAIVGVHTLGHGGR